MRCGPGRGRAWGSRGGASSVCREAPTVRTERRARADRTENMPDMLMTLDVLRLSDWLNADAPCRVKRESTEG